MQSQKLFYSSITWAKANQFINPKWAANIDCIPEHVTQAPDREFPREIQNDYLPFEGIFSGQTGAGLE